MTQQDAQAVVRSVRPAMKDLTERERAQFLYDLTRAVYDGVKFDVPGHADDDPERERIGRIVDAALPPLPNRP